MSAVVSDFDEQLTIAHREIDSNWNAPARARANALVRNVATHITVEEIAGQNAFEHLAALSLLASRPDEFELVASGDRMQDAYFWSAC